MYKFLKLTISNSGECIHINRAYIATVQKTSIGFSHIVLCTGKSFVVKESSGYILGDGERAERKRASRNG